MRRHTSSLVSSAPIDLHGKTTLVTAASECGEANAQAPDDGDPAVVIA
jgi:hypothetical protein